MPDAGVESEPTQTPTDEWLGPVLTGDERLEVATRAGLEVAGILQRSLAVFKVECVIDGADQPRGWPTKKEAAAIRRVLLGMEAAE